MSLVGLELGLRQPLARELFASPPPSLAWLEVHPENYLGRGGQYARMLAEARERWPLVTHGLTMGFGARSYPREELARLSAFAREQRVPWHSDHLCIATVGDVYLHDLLPLPRSASATARAVARICEMTDALERPIAVEPISYYASAPVPAGERVQDEAEQLAEIVERADARLLLDVNNVFVNAQNQGFDARAFIDRLPLERVVQLHVAGHHVRKDGFRIDTHAEPICDEVYELFAYTMRKLARPVAVLLERDERFPPYEELCGELERLAHIYDGALAKGAGHGA